jgi:lysophospholipase L1-like esterase
MRSRGGEILAETVVKKALVAASAVALIATVIVTVGQADPPSKAVAASPSYYLSLGDSWAMGYVPSGGAGAASAGFTSTVAHSLHLQLANFGCSGATTATMVGLVGCIAPLGVPAGSGRVAYPATSQEVGALDFIVANPGKVSLITISIGINDFTTCEITADPMPCIDDAAATMRTNVASLVDNLHTALAASGDATARIIGLSYVDTALGAYVNPGGVSGRRLASSLSTAYTDSINPALRAVYDATPGGSFVDETSAPFETAASGGETPFATTVDLKPFGTIPAAVAETCVLTFYCSMANNHPTERGYAFIAKLIVADFAAH